MFNKKANKTCPTIRYIARSWANTTASIFCVCVCVRAPKKSSRWQALVVSLNFVTQKHQFMTSIETGWKTEMHWPCNYAIQICTNNQKCEYFLISIANNCYIFMLLTMAYFVEPFWLLLLILMLVNEKRLRKG